MQTLKILDPRFKTQHLDDELSAVKQCVMREGIEVMGSGTTVDNYNSEDIMVSGSELYENSESVPPSKRHKLRKATKEVSTSSEPQTIEEK